MRKIVYGIRLRTIFRCAVDKVYYFYDGGQETCFISANICWFSKLLETIRKTRKLGEKCGRFLVYQTQNFPHLISKYLCDMKRRVKQLTQNKV